MVRNRASLYLHLVDNVGLFIHEWARPRLSVQIIDRNVRNSYVQDRRLIPDLRSGLSLGTSARDLDRGPVRQAYRLDVRQKLVEKKCHLEKIISTPFRILDQTS